MSEITTFLILSLSVACYDKDINCTRNSMEAYYIQSGNRAIVEKYVDTRLEHMLNTEVGTLLFISNIIKEQKVVWRETF